MNHTILERIKIRLRQFTTQQNTDYDGNITVDIVFDHLEENPIIEELIEQAKREVIHYRHYPKHFKDEDIQDDIEKNYEDVVINLVLYEYNKEGAEFEISNSQGGNSRTYVTRQSILNDVLPLISSI